MSLQVWAGDRVRIGLDVDRGDPRGIDQAGRLLVAEFARARVSVRPAAEAPPPGAKSAGMHSLAELIMTGGLSAATVTAAASVIVGFVQRGAARRLVLRDGDRELDVTGVSPQDIRSAVEAFLRSSLVADQSAPPGGPEDQ
jgi:hypothetical protein